MGKNYSWGTEYKSDKPIYVVLFISRNKDNKDYGKLIPGHGGILDRFDSVIFTAPIIYYLATML